MNILQTNVRIILMSRPCALQAVQALCRDPLRDVAEAVADHILMIPGSDGV